MNSTNKAWRILGMINFGLDIFILVCVLSLESIEIPPFLQVFGRAHPLVLHFPIVFIFLLPFIPFLLSSLSISKEIQQRVIGQYFQIAHFLCAVTVLFGLFLFVEGGYNGQDIMYHKWGGVLLLFILIVLENLWNYRSNQRNTWQMLMYIPLVVLVITSHIGAGVTHGRDFLTEPIRNQSRPQVPLDEALVFQDVIHPILEKKCIDCHNSSKSKGDLVLEDSTSILRGGEDGAVLVAGIASKSPMFQRLILDIDHDDHMPPKGNPQLTQTEIGLIEEWIGRTHLFDMAYSDLEPADTLAAMIKSHYEANTRVVYDMKPASESDIRSLNDDYRLVIPVALDAPALYARFLSASHFQQDHLTALTKLQDQVVDLYLGHMPVNDEDMATVGQFSNLQVLNLNGTGITDQGLASLYDLPDLQKIFLTSTSVSEKGIEQFLDANPVKNIYLWGSGVDSTGIKSLQDKFPGTEIVGETNPFGHEIIALNPPQITPDQPFFEARGLVTLDHPIPGVTIRYTTDGSKPDSLTSQVYDGPLEVSEDTEFQFQAFKLGWYSSPVLERSFYGSIFRPDSSWLATLPNERYSGNGASSLTDLKAGDRVVEDKSYLGYRKDAILGFSFDEAIPLNRIVVSSMTRTQSYIMPPLLITIEIRGEGGNWTKVGSAVPDQPGDHIDYEKIYTAVNLDRPHQVKEVRVVVSPVSHLPAWHPGKGDKGWVFLDEVLFQ